MLGACTRSNRSLHSFSPMKPVTVYTTDVCAYCVRAKNLLKRKQIPFTEINVTHEPEKRAWLVKATGGLKTVPQIFIGDEPIGGSDDLHELDRTGELDRKLA
jgi:glutaredoxin 3